MKMQGLYLRISGQLSSKFYVSVLQPKLSFIGKNSKERKYCYKKCLWTD